MIIYYALPAWKIEEFGNSEIDRRLETVEYYNFQLQGLGDRLKRISEHPDAGQYQKSNDLFFL